MRAQGDLQVAYLFIDGGALRKMMEDFVSRYWPGERPSIDYAKIGGRRGYLKTFYYDAWPDRKASDTDESFAAAIKEHDDLIELVSGIEGFHAYAGETRHRKRRGLEQKMVDVMIAVDMLRHTFNGNMGRLHASDQ
jgi:hypothetical protein